MTIMGAVQPDVPPGYRCGWVMVDEQMLVGFSSSSLSTRARELAKSSSSSIPCTFCSQQIEKGNQILELKDPLGNLAGVYCSISCQRQDRRRNQTRQGW